VYIKAGSRYRLRHDQLTFFTSNFFLSATSVFLEGASLISTSAMIAAAGCLVTSDAVVATGI
jgi:hypothetical protein